jgi:transcriptional regulator with XRE-family HTH domain
MITGAQIRAARNALRWTAQRLAEEAEVTPRTIVRFESVDAIPPSHSSTLQKIQTALERAGVEFIGSPDDRPGVRFSLPRSQRDEGA